MMGAMSFAKESTDGRVLTPASLLPPPDHEALPEPTEEPLAPAPVPPDAPGLPVVVAPVPPVVAAPVLPVPVAIAPELPIMAAPALFPAFPPPVPAVPPPFVPVPLPLAVMPLPEFEAGAGIPWSGVPQPTPTLKKNSTGPNAEHTDKRAQIIDSPPTQNTTSYITTSKAWRLNRMAGGDLL